MTLSLKVKLSTVRRAANGGTVHVQDTVFHVAADRNVNNTHASRHTHESADRHSSTCDAFLSMQDDAVSVREAAVDLLGRHIGADAGLAAAYLDMLVAASRDAGVSVRKRALGILWESCIRCAGPQNTPQHAPCKQVVVSLPEDTSIPGPFLHTKLDLRSLSPENTVFKGWDTSMAD